MKNFEIATIPTFRCFNLKSETCFEKAKSLVNFKVLSAQLDGLLKSLPLEEFEQAHPGVDFWTASDDLFDGVVEADLMPEMLQTRENASLVKEAINKLPFGLDAWNALNDTDKCFIIIEAHKTMPSICLEKYLFKDEKGTDLNGIENAVKAFYQNGRKKDLANVLRTLFFKVCGNEDGELFNALSFTRSEWANADLVNFSATFGGRAKRQTKKDKSGQVTYGNYDYVNKFSSWKTQSQALTTLLGVVMESRKNSYCNVIRG